MDDTEQLVGWVLLGPSTPGICGRAGAQEQGHRAQIYGRGNKYGEHALEDPYPLEATARRNAHKGDAILTLQEARIWMTLNNL